MNLLGVEPKTKIIAGSNLLIHVLAHIAFEACRIQNLPKLVEDIFQTSINTDPGGALRLVQRRSGHCWVRGEWLNDILSAQECLVDYQLSSWSTVSSIFEEAL
ncbi:hypothetical protein F2Q69_00055616 [Brassica cretica]|uniref:Uncharacterized protein n=1 Tax=Brassica cretica TaxID=69181 RepID=A0A8S9MUF0_BRACR|nr:hypothetical protein F2Q69_00055616 [Brassica cretica]